MKNLKFNFKSIVQSKARWLLTLIAILTLGVGQMWAGDMYIKGERNSWSSEKMTEEVSNSRWTFTAYWKGGTSYDAFKITSKTDWSGLNLGGNGSNVSLSWGTKSGALYNNGGSKDIILPSFETQGGIIKITVTYESDNYYVKAEKLAEEQTTWRQISAPKIYWNNTDANYTNVTMINGRYTNYGGDGKGTVASPLTHITNTNLWYNTSINNGTGDGSWFTSTLFVDANWDGWESGNVPTERAMYATSNTAVNTAALNSNTFLFSGANANRGATLNRSQLSSGYSELNKTQTVEVYVKVGSGSYTKRTSSWPGTLTPDRYYLSNATTATHVNNTALTAGSSVTVSAVLTSAFSLSESSTADGYNFDGWGTSSSSTPSGKNAAYSISSITGANTICAFFTAPSYSITYNLNGGTQQVSPAPATSYTVESSAITLPTPTRDGYDFDGWFDNSSFTGSAITTIAAGSTGNKEYWAKWTVASTYYDVTFGVAASGHGTLAAVKTVNSASITSGDDLLSGTAITFTATPSSYYEVEGWYTNSACTLGKHDAGETTYSVASLGSDITVYVKFKPITYNITYNLNSGTNNPGNPATYTYESSAITLQDPTRDGYTFGGWYTEVGLTNRVYSIAAGSNGNKAFWAKWTEKMTTVTVNVSPSEAGTLTVGGAAFTPGNTTTAGVTTSRTVVATPASGKVFLDWSVSGNATGTNSTNTYTLKGNGSAGTGTLTANFGVASGWYMIGDNFGGWGTSPYPTSDQLTYPYRGMSGVYYIPVASLPTNKYWRVRTGSTQYNTSSSTTDDNTISKGTIYSLSANTSKASKPSSALSDVWIVVNTGSSKKLWVQDPQTFYNVNVTNEGSGSKGTYKVTLKTTSAFTKGDNVFETTQYASGETFTVTVTGVTGYIPTITIGDNTPVTWWKEQGTYTADGTMSAADVAVTISYTPTRAVRFAKTTGCETLTATGPSSTSVSDNTKIKDGTEITFHQENNTGYTFSKWYSNNTGTSGTEYSDDEDDYELTVSSTSYTIYPLYTEDMHTVTLNSSVSGGHVEIGGETVTSTSAGIATASPTITAVADSGYYFTGWTGDINSGVTLASGTSSSTAITIRATADSKSITANFDKRWIIAGDWEKDGGGSWVMTNKMDVSKLSGTTFASKRIDGLTANTDYDFKLYDLTGDTHWVGFASDGEVYEYGDDSIMVNTYPGYNIKLRTAAQGDYYFYYNLKNHKLNISIPASRQVTMGTRTISNGITSAYTGGTISAEDERDNVITNGLYIKSGDDITFTASPRAGYIWRGWYNSSGCTGAPVATERVHTDEDVTAVGFTRYGLFEEALYTVTVHRNDVIETTVKVGVDTKPAITASTAPTGKVFDRWVTTGSATVADPYSSTTTITGATDNVSTVTATFKELPKIYIDLTSATGWSPDKDKMYVVFYKSGGYFDENNGTGLSSTYVINATPLEMTKMGTSKIWYYAYDPTSGDFAGQTITCVAFVDHTFAANYGNFTSATVVYRTDFSSCMNMFVVTDNTGTNKNKSCYYRNTNAISDDAGKGYWRKYEEKNSGFYLNNLPGGSVEFTNEDGGNTYTAVANLDANTTYYFYLGGCNGWNWSNNNGSYPFNYSNPTRMVQPYGDVSSDGLRCKLTTTAAGYYTFTLTPQNTRNVQVSVAFPVAANDYRAVYNNAASSPTISRPSNIIKSDQNSGTISLWLNKGTNYISFQKAAVAVGGAVSWSACGSQQTVSDVPEAGIYNMTLTRDGSTYTVSTPVKYEGDLYIRTDCAPGKWADYTENRLTENTFNFDPEDDATYDYYYCKWINDAGTNVRCVIANDINVAISDTLKAETILNSGETLPEGANVRFSYNSVTNELKRSYLTGASTDVFLNIMPDAASSVYKTDGTTDMYNGGVVGARNKFSDLGNWVYEMDVKVYPGATASVQANYNSTQQPLIAAGTTLLGGTKEVLYQIRLIYDFRTNNLMSAWMPSGTIDEAITLNSDMMIVRRAQNQANKLSFDDGGKLDKVKRAYGVFEFHKADMVDHMSTWSDFGYTYGQCMYYFSLPFDVNVADIFGVGTMGDDWRIQFYNGTKRAEKGWFAGDGTTTFWEDVPADTVLHAYEGYCLMLNRSHFNNGSHAVWNNVTTDAYLYFPSVAPVSALADNTMEITVPSHECKIDRFFDQDKAKYYDSSTKTWKKGARNHKYVDSHWNLMGTPLFEDATADELSACKVTIGDADSTLNYIYEWIPSTNSLSARQVLNTGFTFKPMYAYMVQYAGKVTFTGASITPASIAARRTSENKQYTIDLLLTKEDQFAGRTYVELRENAVDSFMLNEDMYMMKGSKIGDIYTHADGYELAANVLSVNSHIVPVSIDAKAAGTYTISMPSNFSGTVTLIDKYAQTRTNLAFEDYEIYLEKGTIADRFELEININKTPTAIDGVGADNSSLKDGNAHKFIMNDMLYILKDGVLFDARGNRVK